MSKLCFSKDHEWIAMDGDVGTVGITLYAQSQLGDIVFVEVPEVGRDVKAGNETAVVESVKAASEVYSPVSGTIAEGNSALTDTPETVNTDPQGEGWFFKIKITDTAELDGLMDQVAYDAYVAELDV
jgi:glycine cleavage system H protein